MVIVASAAGGCRKPAPPSPPAAQAPAEIAIAGNAAPWTESARVVREFATPLRCLDRSPAAGRVRVIVGDPPRADDVSLSDGATTPAPIAATALAGGCPRLAPGGKSVAFESVVEGRAMIMHASSPDGQGAKPFYRGTLLGWTLGGEAVVTADGLRAALVAVNGAMRALPAPVGPPARLLAAAGGSDDIALVGSDDQRTLLRLHEARLLRETAVVSVPRSIAALVYDRRPRCFAFAVTEERDGVWIAWRDGARFERIGRLPGETIALAVAVGDELVLATSWSGGARLRVAPAAR